MTQAKIMENMTNKQIHFSNNSIDTISLFIQLNQSSYISKNCIKMIIINYIMCNIEDTLQRGSEAILRIGSA